MDTRSSSKHDSDKIDDSSEESRDKPRKRGRKRKEEKIKHIEYDDSNDDDSGSEEPNSKRSKDFGMIGSPGSHSPGHREPRSCVLNQRQKRKPLSRLLEQLLKNLEKKDHNQFFAWPVEDNYAPNYSTIIKHPMDFSTMKQKIDENAYKTLNCFIADFKLMCNNALKYNKPGTVYHKAARKLLHYGTKQLVSEKLRPLGSILTYMYEIPAHELGFEMGKMDVKALKQENANSEIGAEFDIKENESLSESDRIKMKLDAIREIHRRKLVKRAFPRMDLNGYTSLQILVDNDGVTPASNQRPVSLGLFTGKISQGTATIPGFREDRKNLVKGVKPLNYGAFGSYAPSYDSTFATLSKEDSHLLYHTYGEETGITTNENMLRFSSDSPWTCIYNMEEMFPTRNASKNSQESSDDSGDVKVAFDELRTLTEIGIDVDFLNDIEDEVTNSQQEFVFQKALDDNASVLKKLENEQRERLSLPIPSHLSNIAKPTLTELETAKTAINNLKEMMLRVPPKDIISVGAVRKAMGVTLDHLNLPSSEETHHNSSDDSQIADNSHGLSNGDVNDELKVEDDVKKLDCVDL